MEITGRIKMISAVQQVSDNFKKRELVVTIDEQYPQPLFIEFHQDKCDLLNNHKAGDTVKVSINIRGREWVNPQGETKYFNSLNGWKIENLASGGSAPTSTEVKNNAKQKNYTAEPIGKPDDLPF